jgi:hypothetical protein
MKTTLMLLSLSALASVLACAPPAPPLACNRAALTAAQRKRHFDELGPALRAALRAVRELPDGYEFEFPADPATRRLVDEWVAGERLCCPFLKIDPRPDPGHTVYRMRLSGHPGVKQFIEADLNAWIAPRARQVLEAHAVMDAWIEHVERDVVSAAEALPEDQFNFAPQNGEFHGVRTFARQLAHLAAANYQLGATILAGTWQRTRLGLAMDAVAHSDDHHGQLVEYLRMNGIVPPASR